MRITVKNLKGNQLNWLVEQINFKETVANGGFIKKWYRDNHDSGEAIPHPCVHWAYVGDIVEKDNISINPFWIMRSKLPWPKKWLATSEIKSEDPRLDGLDVLYEDTNPLIAILRVHVAMHYGPEFILKGDKAKAFKKVKQFDKPME